MYSVYSCRHFFSEVIIQPCKISVLEIKNQLRHSILYSLAAVNLCRRLAEVPKMEGSGGEKSGKRQRMAE